MARRDAASDSAPRPSHQRIRDSQRSSSPTRRRLAEPRADGERVLPAAEGLLRGPRQVGLEREPLEQRGALLRLGPLGHGQGGAVVLGRLHVRPGGAGRPGRGRRVRQHDGAVGRAPRVVDHARQVDALAVEQRGQHGPLQLAPAQGRQLRLDAGPGDLVTEPHHLAVALQHPGVQARFEIRARGRDRGLHQPQLGAPRHHGDQLDHLPRGRLEARRPGQHRVADGAGRHLVLVPRQDLGHEERVAARGAVDLVSGTAGAARQLADRLGGQGRQVDPAHQRRRQLSHGGAQGGPGLVAAERHEQGPGGPPHAAPQNRHQVERGLVGPVGVLDDHRAGRGARVELVQRRGDHGLARGARVERGRQLPARGAGDVAHRAEGAGVSSGSHAPSRRRARPPTRSPRASTRLVFPTPASPATSTTRPSPAAASASAASTSASAVSRSSRSMRRS